MRKSRRFLAAVLTAITLFTTPAFAANTDGLKNFQPVASWSDGLFTDLEPNSWYIKNVQTAYELGLMKGVGSGAFSPNGTISLGETIALAARVHSIYKTGKADFTQGSPWYQVYVDYAAQNGIFTGNASTNYTASVTRRQFAAILAKALPEEALEPINTVDDGMIPDVPEGAANYDDIYLLYRAGVLTGSDSKGTYHPETTIGRSSVATVDSNGTVTGISKGKTIITVSYGEMESPPVVITVFQSEPTFTTPKMNYNYGPMPLVDRTHSGGVNQIVHLDRVEFTRVEDWDFGTVQELFLTVEGENFCYGKNGFTMRIKFYDANGTLLDTGHLTYVGGRDKPFSRRW